MCSSGCAAQTARTPSGKTLPSFDAATSTLCPLASTAPVSWTLMCPPAAAMAASYGRMNAESATTFADVPPAIMCTCACG